MATMTATQPVRAFDHVWTTSKRRKIESQETVSSLPTPISTPALRHVALTVNQSYQYEFSDAFVPQLGAHEILLRTKAIGLNPIDWKTVEHKFCMPLLPWINGRECAAVVEDVGSGVSLVSKGQRVWTSTYYKDRRAGCFQDLVVAPEHTVIGVPNGLSFTDAACLGVGGLTAAMTIWKWFDVPMHRKRSTRSTSLKKSFALIWGGSTITGQFAIQILSEAGLRVIAVTSQRTSATILELGASHVIPRDGKSLEEISAEICDVGQDNIIFGIDLVSPQTATEGVRCMSKTRPARFAPLAVPAPAIQAPPNVEIVTVEMKRFVLDATSRQYATKLAEVLDHGRVRVPETIVLPGGLRNVEPGLERLRRGDMGGRKLVVEM